MARSTSHIRKARCLHVALLLIVSALFTAAYVRLHWTLSGGTRFPRFDLTSSRNMTQAQTAPADLKEYLRDAKRHALEHLSGKEDRRPLVLVMGNGAGGE